MKASVITVCKNAQRSIRETIKSVISQKQKCEVEYIIIDGASTDGTLDVVDEYKKYIDIFVSERDSGIYDAMNKGLELASGDIIGFLNSGDSYYENALSDVINSFESTGADVVYGHVIYLDNGIESRIRRGSEDPSTMLSSMVTCHQGIFVKSDIHKTHPFDTVYRIAADRKMLLDLYLEGYFFYKLDKIIAYYDPGFSVNYPYELSIENFKITYNAIINHKEISRDNLDRLEEEVYLNEFFFEWSNYDDKFRNALKAYFYASLGCSNKFMIWGTGNYGQIALDVMGSLGFIVSGFIDSYPKSKIMGDYTVSAPEDAKISDDQVLLISTRNNNDEILKKICLLDNLKSSKFAVFVDLLVSYEKKRRGSIEQVLRL